MKLLDVKLLEYIDFKDTRWYVNIEEWKTRNAPESFERSRIHNSNIYGGEIIINKPHDLIKDCRLEDVKIKTELPLLVYFTVIDESKEDFVQICTIDKDKPHPIMFGCYLSNCVLPTAYYEQNYIIGDWVHDEGPDDRNNLYRRTIK